MNPLIAGLGASMVSMTSAAPLPMLIGHRGASFVAPENTMAAFQLAWQEGADGIETDVYLSKDGRVVASHDPTLERTAGSKRSVTQSTFAELSTFDVGSWKAPEWKGERIPVLEEILDALPAGKWFFIEIKDGPRIVEPIAKILANRNVDREKVVLISFSEEVIQVCREKARAYHAFWISDLKGIDNPETAAGYLKKLSDCGAQGLLFKATAPVTKEWLAKAREGNRKMFCWTVDQPALATKMAGLGVDFIGTNRPAFLRTELSKP